jgi:hypothetical protein
MPDLDEAKNKAMDSAQQEGEQAQDQAEDKGQSAKDKSSSMMNDAKSKMDVTGDGKFNADDVKKMGEDAVSKVKGLFKKS